jgi:hypothetical protein
MPADDFAPLAEFGDADLAALFGAPVEQMRARRWEVAR